MRRAGVTGAAWLASAPEGGGITITRGNWNNTGNESQLSITLPTHASGDGIYVILAVDDSGGDEIDASVVEGGWSIFAEQAKVSNNCKAFLIYKQAAGSSETLTVDLFDSISLSPQSERACAQIRVVDGGGTPEAQTTRNSTNGTPQPPAITPSGGAGDYLFWVAVTEDEFAESAITVAPTDYDQLVWNNTGGGTESAGASIFSAERQATIVATETPAAFTGNSDTWVEITIAIPV